MEFKEYAYGCGCISQGSITIRKCDKCLKFDLSNEFPARDEVSGLSVRPSTGPVMATYAGIETDLDAVTRKSQPVYSGVLKYFPDALLEVAKVSKLGNDQHNPGEPLHWARGKSMDQLDAAVRHILDYAKGVPTDTDGGSHLAKAAWRILAQLQLQVEAERGL